MCFPSYMRDTASMADTNTVSTHTHTQLPQEIRPDLGRSGEAGRRGQSVLQYCAGCMWDSTVMGVQLHVDAGSTKSGIKTY